MTGKNSGKSIFISTPISNVSDHELRRIKEACQGVSDIARRCFPKYDVFCVALEILSVSELESPESSAERDLAALKKCEAFVLLYPRPMSSSALIELGYAIAMGKPVLIISPSEDMLPFIIKGLIGRPGKQISTGIYDFESPFNADIVGKFLISRDVR